MENDLIFQEFLNKFFKKYFSELCKNCIKEICIKSYFKAIDHNRNNTNNDLKYTNINNLSKSLDSIQIEDESNINNDIESNNVDNGKQIEEFFKNIIEFSYNLTVKCKNYELGCDKVCHNIEYIEEHRDNCQIS